MGKIACSIKIMIIIPEVPTVALESIRKGGIRFDPAPKQFACQGLLCKSVSTRSVIPIQSFARYAASFVQESHGHD